LKINFTYISESYEMYGNKIIGSLLVVLWFILPSKYAWLKIGI